MSPFRTSMSPSRGGANGSRNGAGAGTGAACPTTTSTSFMRAHDCRRLFTPNPEPGWSNATRPARSISARIPRAWRYARSRSGAEVRRRTPLLVPPASTALAPNISLTSSSLRRTAAKRSSERMPAATPLERGMPGPIYPRSYLRLRGEGEPHESGLSQSARAGIGDAALHRPSGQRHEVEQLSRGGAQPESRAHRGDDLRKALAHVGLEAVGLLQPQQHPYLVEREHGEVGAGDEDRRSDEAVLAREQRDDPVAHRTAEHRQTRGEGRTALAEAGGDRVDDPIDRQPLPRSDAHDVGRVDVRRSRIARDDRDDRDARTACGAQRTVVLAEVDVDGASFRAADANGGGVTPVSELALEHPGQLLGAADDDGPALRVRELLGELPERADRYRRLQRRRRAARPRA